MALIARGLGLSLLTAALGGSARIRDDAKGRAFKMRMHLSGGTSLGDARGKYHRLVQVV